MSTAFTICASAIFMQAAIAGEVPSLPLKGADGCFIATAADDNLAARATALDFAGDIRSGLRRLTGWKLDPLYKPILIALDCEDVPEIRHRVFLSKDGAIRAQIEIPPMEGIDPTLFAREIVSVLARVELARNTEPGYSPTDFPGWFLAGLARQMDMSARQRDFESVWSRWSHGKLESAWTLCGREAIPPSDGALASLPVTWLLDHPESKAACSGLLRRMGAGEEWGPELVAACFLPDANPAGFDEDWDMWMMERGGMVLEPGTTPPGAVLRFRSQLLIFPRDSGIPYGDFGMFPVTPEELVAHVDSPVARRLAGRRAKAVLSSVIGRGTALRETAALFSSALEAAAKGDAEDALGALSAARRMQCEVEAAAAAGETAGVDRDGEAGTIEERN